MEETVLEPREADRMALRRLRLAEAVGIALVTMAVAATVHGLASGEWPTPLAIAVALPFSVLLGLPLVGRRVRAWRLGLVVLLDQTLFHLVASTIGPASAGRSAPVPAGHHAHGILFPVSPPSSDVLAAAVAPDALMIAAHLATAALSFALLRGGWQLILRAIARGAAILLRRLAVVSPATLPVRRPVAAVTKPRPLRSTVLRHALSRRGPPRPALLG